MKILSWNCAGGLRTKIDRALELDPDIALIQEAHDPVHYAGRLTESSPSYWHLAPHTNKGIFVWARPGWNIEPHPEWTADSAFHQIVPLVVTSPGQAPISVWAVWTHGNAVFENAYVGQAHLALDAYEHLLGPRTVMAGDFNSNAIWDRKRLRNHSTLVERLAARGLHSAYHRHTGETHGAESTPTQWQTRRPDWPFHLDYAFVSDDLAVIDVWVGSYEGWCRKKADGGVSDHAPLMVTIG